MRAGWNFRASQAVKFQRSKLPRRSTGISARYGPVIVIVTRSVTPIGSDGTPLEGGAGVGDGVGVVAGKAAPVAEADTGVVITEAVGVNVESEPPPSQAVTSTMAAAAAVTSARFTATPSRCTSLRERYFDLAKAGTSQAWYKRAW